MTPAYLLAQGFTPICFLVGLHPCETFDEAFALARAIATRKRCAVYIEMLFVRGEQETRAFVERVLPEVEVCYVPLAMVLRKG